MTYDVVVREVGPRDGLQLVKQVVPTEIKAEWNSQQASLGFSNIEVTFYVPPKLLPQFGDAAEVVRRANSTSDLVASALVLNMKGAQLALKLARAKYALCFQHPKCTTNPTCVVVRTSPWKCSRKSKPGKVNIIQKHLWPQQLQHRLDARFRAMYRNIV